MTGPITITGRDIIEWDGTDSTGALPELGIDVKLPNPKRFVEIREMVFSVDLDFVLRHGLLDATIYDSHYRGSPQYMVHYEEGKRAFSAGRGEDNPHHKNGDNIRLRVYPWYDGYRETQAAAMEAKYHLKAMQEEIRTVVAKHGLTIEDCDEYPGSYSSARTPEGYIVKLT